ncbi:unnamed protein product, partial [Mesorhabditis belari]|uniref:Uncharacterized protein n=1 Tax=Mesorhabditis belari TaxID=2138241 RepID=A0AAF3EZ14_9BILA
MPQSETNEIAPEEDIRDEIDNEDGDYEEEAENGTMTLEEYYSSIGGDPKKLELARTILVSKLPSEFLEDPYEVFCEAILEMLCTDFKVSRDSIDQVIRVPRLQAAAPDQGNALAALVSFKSKVHKHRMIAQKKVAEEKPSLSVSTIDEIPSEWFDQAGELAVSEVGEGEEEEEHEETNKGSSKDSQKKREKTKEEIEDAKERERKEKEEYIKRYQEDNDDDIPYVTDWDGAPEFQWKICTTKIDHRKIILDNIHFSDLRDPFLYRATVKAESTEIEFPQRYSFDGSKAQKGKITLTFARDVYLMPTAIRSLIYIRSPNQRRIKIYLPQHEVTVKAKDDFEKKLGRVIEQTEMMKQLVVKVLPAECIPTIEKGIEWFPGHNISSVEHKVDGRGQPVALITFSSPADAINAHSETPFVTIDKHKCQVFLMSMEVNKYYLSVFDKAAEKEAFRAKMDRKHEEERKDKDRLKIRASTYKRKVEPTEYTEKRGRWEVPRNRGVARGFRAGFRGTRGFRGGPRLAPSSRTIGRLPISRYDSSSTFVRRENYRGSDRYRDSSRDSFPMSGRSSFGHQGHDSGSSYATVSQSAFDYSSRPSSYFSGEKRRTYY